MRRRFKGGAPDGFHRQGPDALSAHRRPGYPLSGRVPAEPDSVSPGGIRLALTEQRSKPPSDTGVMPPKIHIHSIITYTAVRRRSRASTRSSMGPLNLRAEAGTAARRHHFRRLLTSNGTSVLSVRYPYYLSATLIAFELRPGRSANRLSVGKIVGAHHAAVDHRYNNTFGIIFDADVANTIPGTCPIPASFGQDVREVSMHQFLDFTARHSISDSPERTLKPALNVVNRTDAK